MFRDALIPAVENEFEQIANSDNCRIAGLLGSQGLSQDPVKTTPESGRRGRRHGALRALRCEFAEERKLKHPG
jgi:hypothetical protein